MSIDEDIKNCNTPADRLRAGREQAGLSLEEMAERLEGFTKHRLFYFETGKTKITTSIATTICSTFGWSVRWLLEGTGEMMIDAQHLKNLRLQLFERGILSKAEWEMVELLRLEGIKDSSTLSAILNLWKGTREMVAETTKVKYRTRKRGATRK